MDSTKPSSKTSKNSILDLIPQYFQWVTWEALIERNGVTIDRPFASPHPDHPSIIYPINYGFINDTTSTDGQEIDIFVGSATNKLVALIETADFRKGDREIKLIYNCTPAEIYLVHGFINYAPTLMQGRLVMRKPMAEVWRDFSTP